jgi:hypothetical protein
MNGTPSTECKVIIAGTRDTIVDDYAIQLGLDRLMGDFGLMPTEIVSGCARGPDRAGERWALANSPWTPNGIKLTRFPVTPADWHRYGKRAGIIRNAAMAGYADALIAYWDGLSRGTGNMIDQMRKLAKPVVIVNTEGWPQIKP